MPIVFTFADNGARAPSEADRKALFSRATIHDFKKSERVKLGQTIYYGNR
jgi:hypothetical protein